MFYILFRVSNLIYNLTSPDSILNLIIILKCWWSFWTIDQIICHRLILCIRISNIRLSTTIMFYISNLRFTSMYFSLYICIMWYWIPLRFSLLISISTLINRIFLLKIVTLLVIYICWSKFRWCSYFCHSITFIIFITSYTSTSWISLSIFFYHSCTFFEWTIFVVLIFLLNRICKFSLRIWMSNTLIIIRNLLLSSILSVNTLLFKSIIR